jgi:hypothetical protein
MQGRSAAQLLTGMLSAACSISILTVNVIAPTASAITGSNTASAASSLRDRCLHVVLDL